jgi:uncharacterized repeat protein (TIGR03803 family)
MLIGYTFHRAGHFPHEPAVRREKIMQSTRSFSAFVLVLAQVLSLAALVATLTADSNAAAATETVLYKFSKPPDGTNPSGAVVFDAHGNLFGTTGHGGMDGNGTVFELSPTSSGGWKETIIYDFLTGTNGSQPGSLIFDPAGNLYGTTLFGGTYGKGVIYELSPNGSGSWQQSVLYNFGSGTDSALPVGLVRGAAGNLFGTSEEGGTSNLGTVFELVSSGGTWTEKVLYSFAGGSDDGGPFGGLAIDSKGNLYGTTSGSGSGGGLGTVFEMTRTATGWVKNILHTFTGPEGYMPLSTPLLDKLGNIYVTAEAGGTNNAGTVYELTPSSGGWAGSVIFNFSGEASGPAAGVVMDAAGNLCGTTESGAGTVYRLSQTAGTWKLNAFFRFSGSNGAFPGALILDKLGNFYGATNGGGVNHQGVVFEITL